MQIFKKRYRYEKSAEFSNKTPGNQSFEFSVKFQNISIALGGLSIFLLFFIPQITGLQVAETVSFSSQDGHCLETTKLTKIHCFGDFGHPIELVRSGKSVWGPETSNPYPPLNFIIFLFFSFLAAKISYLFSLLLYLLSLITAMLIPYLHALKKQTNKYKILAISTTLLGTLPFLTVIDRGNSTVWTLPFLYFFIAARMNKIPKKFEIVTATIAICLRPQNLVLLIVFLSKREYKKMVLTFVFSTLLNFLLFMVWDFANTIENVQKQIGVLIHYGTGIPGTWPPSLSFSRGILTLTTLINYPLSTTTIRYISYGLGLLLILKIIRMQNNISDMQVFILTLPLIFLLPASAWPYYSCILLVIIASGFLMNLKIEDVGIDSKFRGNLFLFTTISTTTIICIPIWEQKYNIIQVFVPIIWILTYSIFLFSKWGKKKVI